MLSDKKLKSYIPTLKRDEAKVFYESVLGLKLLSEENYGWEFEVNGSALRIIIVQELTPHPFTVLGWDVDDIASMIKSLHQKGVKFEKYEFFEQDKLGIWTAPSGTKVAWFKDPDGNLLSLSQHPD